MSTPHGPHKGDAPASREERLAAALRANLRRRKHAAKPAPEAEDKPAEDG